MHHLRTVQDAPNVSASVIQRARTFFATQGDIDEEKRLKWGNSLESEVVVKREIIRINSF